MEVRLMLEITERLNALLDRMYKQSERIDRILNSLEARADDLQQAEVDS